jgi:DNA polymerase III sliding clamp (beta) subunit (PCNA family)
MIIRREALQAALAATTDTDKRYDLHAVQVDPSKHAVIATDGHVLLIATDKSPQDDADFPLVPGAEFHGTPVAPVIVPADTVRAMIGTMPKRSTIPILGCCQLSTSGSESTATLTATDLSAPRIATLNREDAGQFPSYERVMPATDRPSIRLVLAVDVLEAIIKAAKAVSATGARAKSPMIHFDVPTGAKDRQKDGAQEVISPVTITVNGVDVNVTGCAMPCSLS